MRRTRPQEDLEALGLFASMRRRDLAVLDRLFDRLDAPAGATLLHRDRPMNWLWVVSAGQLRTASDTAPRLIGPGQCFGVDRLLARTRSDADLFASVDSHVLVMGRRQVLGALDSLPGFAVALLAPGLARTGGGARQQMRGRVRCAPVPTELRVP